ncbi:hypothetical protein ACH5RR_033173 [Cinchona calisaya]|uniref:F-box domain-containing protein n=1 Tax=Cinchona calisaya TaxID=153742 RepID=A0ABD2YM94_9GENT
MKDKSDHKRCRGGCCCCSKGNKSSQYQLQIFSPSASTPRIPTLPDELIFEILSRFPVKSLLRFSCVSKSWLSLISSKQFIATHLEKSSKNDDYIYHRLIYSIGCPIYGLKWSPLQPAFYSPVIEEVTYIDHHMKYLNKCLDKPVKILGSCNGLFCILIDRNHVFLWNPSIKKLRQLPCSGFQAKPYDYARYGFGYDKLNDDYKVVGIHEGVTRIYSCKTDSWKSIEDYIYRDGSPSYRQWAFAKVHFGISLEIGPNKSIFKIVSIDLANERFGEVGYPDSDFSGSIVGVFGGRLSLIKTKYLSEKCASVEVWIMMEYGVRQSWTKVGSVPFSYKDMQYFYLCLNFKIIF